MHILHFSTFAGMCDIAATGADDGDDAASGAACAKFNRRTL
jgi:hypothetical protein